MSTYQPNVNPSSPEGQALQSSIQKQLAVLGWSTEDDAVMAEYCLVMLGNRKTPDQISTELSDLIGGDFDPSFVTWLFDELKKHYPEPSSTPAPAPSAPSSAAPPSGPSTSLPARPAHQGRMFGAAVSGVKRDSREMQGGDREQPPHQRQRFDGNSPSGPRNNGGNKSLFDRMGGSKAQFAPGRNQNVPMMNTMGIPQPVFDAITQTIHAVNSGAHPSALASVPFPALAAHPLSSTLPPGVLAQAQAAAMAQAQAFAQMQNVWNAPPGVQPNAPFGGPPQAGFNPNAAPFNPAFGGPSAPYQQQQNGFRGAPNGGGGRPHPPQQVSKPPVVLPKKPEMEAICKHGVECTKPQCPFSHPSPVATKDSGLVLSSEACEKQLGCQDPDCPKSHVSRAQKTVPSSTSSSAPSPSSPTSATAPPPHTSSTDPYAIAGAGTKPCKFAGSCTRPGCVFLHPWDVRGDPSGGTVPCRYGAACTRTDCHFSHPTNRSAPYNRSKFSATFNTVNGAKSSSSPATSTSTTKTPAIGDRPKETEAHVSERLKRFAKEGEGEDNKVERILPGQQETNGSTSAGGGAVKTEEKEDKVEIHLDDEDDKDKKVATTA